LKINQSSTTSGLRAANHGVLSNGSKAIW